MYTCNVYMVGSVTYIHVSGWFLNQQKNRICICVCMYVCVCVGMCGGMCLCLCLCVCMYAGVPKWAHNNSTLSSFMTEKRRPRG
jgi:hypothetical protein